MGLAEKQALANMKERYLPAQLDALKAAMGGAVVDVTFDDASFTSVAAAQMIPNGLFVRLNADLNEITVDALGKATLQESLKKIHIVCHAQNSYSLDLTGGTLTITGKFDGSLGNDLPGYGDYKQYLMSKL